MQESPFYERIIQRGIERGIEQGIERGIERGIEQGARATTVENTLAILTARFSNADVNAVKLALEAITDLDRLKQLNVDASLAPSFEAFRQKLGA